MNRGENGLNGGEMGAIEDAEAAARHAKAIFGAKLQ